MHEWVPGKQNKFDRFATPRTQGETRTKLILLQNIEREGTSKHTVLLTFDHLSVEVYRCCQVGDSQGDVAHSRYLQFIRVHVTQQSTSNEETDCI